MEYYSIPVLTKAIQFLPDGSNYDKVIDIVKLNGGFAEMVYLNKDGQRSPSNTITERKALILSDNTTKTMFPVHPGNFIILNSDSMYPIPAAEFLTYHVKTTGEISNGVHSFDTLYKSIAEINERYVPTTVDVADRLVCKLPEDCSYDLQEFIKQNAVIVSQPDNQTFYVINGQVFIF